MAVAMRLPDEMDIVDLISGDARCRGMALMRETGDLELARTLAAEYATLRFQFHWMLT